MARPPSLELSKRAKQSLVHLVHGLTELIGRGLSLTLRRLCFGGSETLEGCNIGGNGLARLVRRSDVPCPDHLGLNARSVLNGYKIIYVPFENGRPSGQAEDVVMGFLIDGDKARGRPVGLGVDGQGGLLIAVSRNPAS
jgi:hypothetical protein